MVFFFNFLNSFWSICLWWGILCWLVCSFFSSVGGNAVDISMRQCCKNLHAHIEVIILCFIILKLIWKGIIWHDARHSDKNIHENNIKQVSLETFDKHFLFFTVSFTQSFTHKHWPTVCTSCLHKPLQTSSTLWNFKASVSSLHFYCVTCISIWKQIGQYISSVTGVMMIKAPDYKTVSSAYNYLVGWLYFKLSLIMICSDYNHIIKTKFYCDSLQLIHSIISVPLVPLYAMDYRTGHYQLCISIIR